MKLCHARARGHAYLHLRPFDSRSGRRALRRADTRRGVGVVGSRAALRDVDDREQPFGRIPRHIACARVHEARAARQLVHFTPPSDLLEGSHRLEVHALDARAVDRVRVGLAATPLAVRAARHDQLANAVERARGCQ